MSAYLISNQKRPPPIHNSRSHASQMLRASNFPNRVCTRQNMLQGSTQHQLLCRAKRRSIRIKARSILLQRHNKHLHSIQTVKGGQQTIRNKDHAAEKVTFMFLQLVSGSFNKSIRIYNILRRMKTSGSVSFANMRASSVHRLTHS